MKTKFTLSLSKGMYVIAFLCLLLSIKVNAQVISYSDSWGKSGFTLETESASGIQINFSISEFEMLDVYIEELNMKSIHLPGIFLPNDEGAPDLPGTSRFIAIPEGANATFEITSYRTETIENVEVAPAFRIPKDTDKGPWVYEKNNSIYSQNDFYPAEPVILSKPTEIRGVDVVQLGITPFQYNPVTKQLIVYRDLKVAVRFNGGNGHFGEDRLRSRWFDPILNNVIVNYNSLPKVQYNYKSNKEDQDFEYVIICPNDPVFLAWADSIKQFRTQQGIKTGIFTTVQTGGNNSTAIENFINNAYNTWTIPPAAVLLLGDYGTTGNTIHSPMWNNYCVSDHIYADVNNNNMADIVLARITAQNAAHLQTMITKFLKYERNPPTNPNFYNNPITAMGWQTERWFQICSETINGFWQYKLGKSPKRENAIYSGTPPFTNWSSNQNTSLVVNYFGPNGRGYIPATAQHLTDWGGNATRINNDINSGAFMLQHRDHGLETGWGEPAYSNSNLSGLNNDDLVFVFSINCLTGKYNWSGECFAEAFHRHQKGALGLIAASEVSYSFVNDAYVWGMFDGMWPDFMPDYGIAGPDRLLPAFGNVVGKYFLQYSNWPYNTGDKMVTYYLFHHHGDAFTTVYSEIPQTLNVVHNPVILAGNPQFNVTADNNSLIALTCNGEIIAVAEGTGSPVAINIPFIVPGNTVKLTVTKQNYYRYSADIPVVPSEGAYVISDSTVVNDTLGNNNALLDYGESPFISLRAYNVGVSQAENVTLILRSNSGYVTVIDSTEFYGTIPAGGRLFKSNGFKIAVDPLTPDQEIISFEVAATDGNNNWISYFTLKVQAPVLVQSSYNISDPGGNNNGILDPGETADIFVEITNIGHSEAVNVQGILTTTDALITINSGQQNYGNLLPAGKVTKSFNVTASSTITTGHQTVFDFNMTASLGIASNSSISIIVGKIPVLIVCKDENHNSSPAMRTAFEALDIAYVYQTDFPTDLSLYQSVFVCLGVYSNNHQLTTTEGQLLADFLNSGGMLYMEGGDTWYYDPQTAVHGMFNIVGIGDGSGDLGTILGQAGTFTEGMTFTYSGDNNWIDRLNNIAPAQVILRNQSPSYACAVAYENNTYKTIGASFEFGGLNDTPNEATKKALMEKYIDFFGLGIIPVELVSFEAAVEEQSVRLTWETATELNNSGFEVERSSDGKVFGKIGFIKGIGTTTDKHQYSYIDGGLTGKGKYYYRLKQLDFDGKENYSSVIEVDYSAIPSSFSLSQNYPNPFNPTTTIQFGIPKEVKVTLKVYDALGCEVETIYDKVLEPGYYKHQWEGSKYASGVYFLRLQAGNFTSSKKMMLLK
ncbi:MAG: C25 family cysteine peptidase [Ignavibacteriaceae bacterium]